MLRTLKDTVPEPLRNAYHFLMSFVAALIAGFPSRRLVVVGVTGTKGKSSTLEYLNAIFEAAGWQTALLGTIRTKIASSSKPNLSRMTMPGRFSIQNFLKEAADSGCGIAFLEMTSEGARQYRHRFINLDALIFINLSPEHIESHGSLAAYSNAKFELAKQLKRSTKRPRSMIANVEDPESGRYLTLPVEQPVGFSLENNQPWHAGEKGGEFTFASTTIPVRLPGRFSLLNALAAAELARAMGVRVSAIAEGIGSLERIPGRAEEIQEGQSFTAIVDYAHTPDSLKAIYGAFPVRRKICVLGSTGGGRDSWKRPVMGSIAEEFCDSVILTNEDPYDEDPRSIVDAIASGMKEKKPEIIMNRREAINRALSLARASDVVLITGKGTDPTMQGPRGSSVRWSDAQVVREEIKKIPRSSY